MIRDVAVKVPEPEDFIAEAIFPSHIVVPRCSGRKLLPVSLDFKNISSFQKIFASLVRCLREFCGADVSPQEEG